MYVLQNDTDINLPVTVVVPLYYKFKLRQLLRNSRRDSLHLYIMLTLSMPHITIVVISCLVKKVPSQELLHATEFSVRLV